MSDKETEDDVGLPKATVFKLIQGQSPLRPNETWTDSIEILPPDLGCTKEAKDVLVDCCVGEWYGIRGDAVNVRMDQITFDSI